MSLVADANAALTNADALIILTEWQEFRSPDFDHIKASLTHAVVFDGRNLYNPDLVKRFGSAINMLKSVVACSEI